ncbi:MAG: Txe/YoeB family addiction module toxin [Planctomycetaceae bacterium]|jgi:toxin YoeB|nr:Txe/YoeB family addiction module toxin [Planctomycetaceae bacterium]
MSYVIEHAPQAREDIAEHEKSGSKAVLRKIEKLENELKEHPYTGTGKPEKLKHDLSGKWSRRINAEHRLVYSVEENIVTITIASAKGHYE